jgi:hypothetical protein
VTSIFSGKTFTSKLIYINNSGHSCALTVAFVN